MFRQPLQKIVLKYNCTSPDTPILTSLLILSLLIPQIVYWIFIIKFYCVWIKRIMKIEECKHGHDKSSIPLVHTMAWFMWCTGKWSPYGDHQATGDQSVIGTSHYDITICNDIARDAQCDITMGNDVTRDIHCDVTMNNNNAMCAYDGITMHNDIAMNLYFYNVLLYLFMLVWVVWNKKTRIHLCLIGLSWRTCSFFLCKDISSILQTREVSLHKNNLCVLPDWSNTHLYVLY